MRKLLAALFVFVGSVVLNDNAVHDLILNVFSTCGNPWVFAELFDREGNLVILYLDHLYLNLVANFKEGAGIFNETPINF